jgi:hypothetical protein
MPILECLKAGPRQPRSGEQTFGIFPARMGDGDDHRTGRIGCADPVESVWSIVITCHRIGRLGTGMVQRNRRIARKAAGGEILRHDG